MPFNPPLYVGRPNIGDRIALHRRIDEILDAKWLTNDGAMVREFERRVAMICDVKHAIAVANGTSAIELLIRALQISGEVIVPAFTFIATAHAVRWSGATPVFADVDPRTHTIDPKSIERLLSPKTSAIIGVHLWGNPCNVRILEKIADEHGIPLLFDAAQAFASSIHCKPIGSFGKAEAFSFHATKFVNAAEGGAITTNDDELARVLKLSRNFGFSSVDSVVVLGTNAKMSELHAAMALTSLDDMRRIGEHNEAIFRVYYRELHGLRSLRFLETPTGATTSYQYVVLDVHNDKSEPDPALRDSLIKELHEENVIARRYFSPGAHRSAPYNAEPHREPLTVTERLAAGVLVLPTGTSVSKDDAVLVSKIIRSKLGEST